MNNLYANIADTFSRMMGKYLPFPPVVILPKPLSCHLENLATKTIMMLSTNRRILLAFRGVSK